MTAQPINLFPDYEETDGRPPHSPHGQEYGYYTLGCRCDDCTDWHTLWHFGYQNMRIRQAQRREAHHRGTGTLTVTTTRRDPAPIPIRGGCRVPSVYTIELHRADHEPLCEACVVYMRTFQ